MIHRKEQITKFSPMFLLLTNELINKHSTLKVTYLTELATSLNNSDAILQQIHMFHTDKLWAGFAFDTVKIKSNS